MKVVAFLKNWSLIIAIFTGIATYFIYTSIPALNPTHQMASRAVEIIQPILIFAMLFITFCRVNPRKLRLCKWHLSLLLFQCGMFGLISCILYFLPQTGLRVTMEGAMICLICPTATAGAVITRKLGGNIAHITTYTILINIANAILIPVIVPFIHPNAEMDIFSSTLESKSKIYYSDNQ